MSVASTNPFALLSEETSPPGSPGPATQKNEASASQPARTTAKSKGPASRGGRYYARGGKPSRDSTQDVQEEAPVGDERAPKKADGEGRGRGRGRGRGDRGRGGRGRTFDRHSATGKTDSDKKIHQGWGGDEGGDELKAEEAGTTDAQAEGVAAAAADGWDSVPIDPWSQPAPADPWAIPPAGDDTAAPAVEEEKGDDDRKPRDRDPEDEENTISYDQYLAQMKDNTTSSIPKLEGVREANEGADDAWGDVVEHKKNEDDEAYFVGKTKGTGKVRAEKKEKVYIEIDAHFERPSRGGRGRGRGGDRGRGRGRGSRGQQSNGTQADINVDDKNAFPTLS